MLLVTFHGGTHGINNVFAYSDDGTKTQKEILECPEDLLSELRGVYQVSDDTLWVASGGKSSSAIYCFHGPNGSPPFYEFGGEVAAYRDPRSAVKGHLADSLRHPFDFVFDTSGQCYVSNQDTDVVARLRVDDLQTATPAPIAPALGSGTFLDGTFVACSQTNLPGVPTTSAVPLDAGLAVTIKDGKVARSVRGVVWANGVLYVADEPGGAVKVYDAEGGYRGKSTVDPLGMPLNPVHLTVHGGCLYACTGTDIFWAELDASSPATLSFQPVEWPAGGGPPPEIRSPAGLAWGTADDAYLADRVGQRIWSLGGFEGGAIGSVLPWRDHGGDGTTLSDQPEFLLYIAGDL